MKQQTVRIGVDLEREMDTDLSRWAEMEERSKKRHLKTIARKVISAWKVNPQSEPLRALGLVR